ncbi:MAG TPA: extracellular solute-binding protein [Candidatus Limnocylindrales bacterium]|nr:extracellular solute-binding protein [Candidatus Limnocylindrales bacterium]
MTVSGNNSAGNSVQGGRSVWRRIVRSRSTFFILGILTLLAVLNVNRVLGSTDLEPGELVILSGVDASVGGQRQKLLDAWNAEHPANPARFQLASSKADDQHSAMVADAQTEVSTVDIYNLDVTWVAEFASAGFIRELGSVDTDGFLEQPLKAGYYGGDLYALPFNTDAGLLYYRTDILPPEKLPSRLPPTESQVQEMLARDPSLKAGYATQLASYEGLTVNALEAIWAGGDDVVDDDGRVARDLPQVPTGLRLLAEGLNGKNPGLLPGSRDAQEGQTTNAFAAGEVALMRNWPVAYHQLKQMAPQTPGGFDIRGKYAVRALPTSVLGGQNLAVSRHTKKPRAAEALIQFLTSATSEIQLYRDGGLAPTRTAAYQDPGARAVHSDAFTDTLREAVEHARQRPVTTHYQLFSSVFQGVVNKAIDNGGSLPPRASRDLANALDGKLE